MKKEDLFKEALSIAQNEELRTGEKVKEVYILDGEVYLNKHDLKGKMQDYTLVRSDIDTKFPSNINTEKQKRRGF